MERHRSRRTPLMVKVLVFELINNSIVRERVVNLPKSTEWMNKLMVWAVKSHYAVEVVNVEDDT